jgi:plastocyanin
MVVAVGALLLSGCAGSLDRPVPPVTIDFGTQSPTPGMSHMSGMSDMTAAPIRAPLIPAGGSIAPQSNSPTSGTQVDITNFAFAPAAVTVPAGTAVTWTNHDDEPHTVVARDGSFRSPALDTDATYRFTFTTPGTFDYICSIHPMMTATVVVTK